MKPLLQNHDHKALEIFCYSDTLLPDAMTDQLRQYADVWRETAAIPDEQLAAMIRADRIDLLVDLTMHMANNRLLVFARKPAPVQVTYLACCSTTGVQTIDYRLTDIYLDPPGKGDEYYSERSIRLPETFWCYEPGLATPDVAPLPALNLVRPGESAAKQITFGCLNNFGKVTPAVLKTWCEILRAVPDSRLLLHAREGSHRRRVRDIFAAEQIDPNRLTFTGPVSGPKYFEMYRQIDVCLDPFPYAGGTTTCDALWMGVPVVTLSGQTAAGRAGVSILSNVGLAELVADSPEQYAQIAIRLVSNLDHLSVLRSGMRERMQKSPLMDGPKFAQNIEAAYQQMWQRCCQPVLRA